MDEASSGNLLQRYGVPPDWGMPADAVAWFTDDESNALKVLVADYANGRRVTLRKRSRDWQIDFTRSGSAS